MCIFLKFNSLGKLIAPHCILKAIQLNVLSNANRLDCRLSRTSLTMFNKEQLIYNKDKVLEFTCWKWDSELRDNFSNVCRDDPYNLEQLHPDEYLHGYINSLNALRDPLFKRHENRIDNTNFADFLHGHSLRFQDFTYSVLKANKNLYAPLYLKCTARPDSPHHQLFECPNFQSELRSHM